MSEMQTRVFRILSLLELGYPHNHSDLDREGLCAEPPSKKKQLNLTQGFSIHNILDTMEDLNT